MSTKIDHEAPAKHGPQDKKRPKHCYINVRIDDVMRAEIERIAEQEHMTLARASRWLMWRGIDTVPPRHNGAAEWKDAIRQVSEMLDEAVHEAAQKAVFG